MVKDLELILDVRWALNLATGVFRREGEKTQTRRQPKDTGRDLDKRRHKPRTATAPRAGGAVPDTLSLGALQKNQSCQHLKKNKLFDCTESQLPHAESLIFTAASLVAACDILAVVLGI